MNKTSIETMIEIDIPATYEHIHLVDTSIKSVLSRVSEIPEREMFTYNVELAVHETCTNIVAHAYAGKCGRIKGAIKLFNNPQRIVVDLFDTGAPFDPASVPEPTLEKPQIHGYGLFLARQLMDKVIYNRETKGNHWTLIKKF